MNCMNPYDEIPTLNQVSRSDTGTEIFGEDEEAFEEDKEKLAQVTTSFSFQKAKRILDEMDRINSFGRFSKP